MGCVQNHQRPVQTQQNSIPRTNSQQKFNTSYKNNIKGLDTSIASMNSFTVPIPYPQKSYSIIDNRFGTVSNVSNVSNITNPYGFKNRAALSPNPYGFSRPNIIQQPQQRPSINNISPMFNQSRASISSRRSSIQRAQIISPRNMKRTSSFMTYGFPQVIGSPGERIHPKAQALLDLQKKLNIKPPSENMLYMSKASSISSQASMKQNKFALSSQKQISFGSIQQNQKAKDIMTLTFHPQSKTNMADQSFGTQKSHPQKSQYYYRA